MAVVTQSLSSSPRFPSQARAHRGATVPKPFNLSTGNKKKVADEESVYVSMAQRIQQFEKRTPERYHLRSRRSQERGRSQFLLQLHREPQLQSHDP